MHFAQALASEKQLSLGKDAYRHVSSLGTHPGSRRVGYSVQKHGALRPLHSAVFQEQTGCQCDKGNLGRDR